MADFAGGWFVFALREAVAWDGQYGSPRQAAAYYRTISRQIEAACRNGRLTCEPGLAALMPPVTESQMAWLPGIFAQLYDMIALRDSLELADHSTGDATQMRAMEDILNRPKRTRSRSEENAAVLDGWFTPKADAWLQLRCTATGHEGIIPVPRLPSPDLATYFKNNALIYDRFKISVPAEAGCGLQTTNDAGGGPVLSLASAKPGPVFLPEGELYFGAVTLAGPDRAGAGAQHVLKGMRLVYRTVLPIAGDRCLKRRDQDAASSIGRHPPQRVCPNSRDIERLADRTMDRIGRVANQALRRNSASRTHTRDQRRHGRSAHAKPCRAFGKAEKLTHPARQLPLHFNRRVIPSAGIGVHPGGQHRGQHADGRAAAMHPSHEAWVYIAERVGQNVTQEFSVDRTEFGSLAGQSRT